MQEKSGTRVSGGFDPLVHAVKLAARARHAVPGDNPELVDRSETLGVRPAYLDRVLGHEVVRNVEELPNESVQPVA